ncbi:hypothetical protein C8R43DRAFT_1131801 [Mycena crocata]|nr:hypothetical protein C8R43DRAFT_1131801 [Mycena crocata]
MSRIGDTRGPNPSPVLSLAPTALWPPKELLLSLALATNGIGRAVALQLADDGFDVAVNDMSFNLEKLETLVDEIQKKGRASSKCIADVSKEDEVKQMVEAVVEYHGGLDVMVANAGVIGRQLPFTEGRGGRIIGASSLGGQQGNAAQAVYCASKAAMRGLTQAAAQEFGPHNITVNAYAPGFIDTPMTRTLSFRFYVDDDQHGLFSKRGFMRQDLELLERTPLKRAGTSEDVASLVSFLASKGSQFITGQAIATNGGVYFA